MGRTAKNALVLAVCVAGAIAIGSCGGEDAELLPGETAREITANLDKVSELSDEGDCVGAESAAQQVGEQIEAVRSVDPKLKRALVRGAERLNEVVDECEEATTEAVEPTLPSEAEEEATEKEKPEKGKGKEKEKKPAEVEPEAPPSEPSLPPQAEDETGPPGAEGGEEVGPSGGVSPGNPVGEGG